MERFLANRTFRLLIYGLLILALIYMIQQLSPILTGMYRFLKAVLAPFLIAMIISYVLNPVVGLLTRRKVPRTMAVLLIYVTFIASVAVMIMNVTPMFMHQLRELNQHMPEITMKTERWIDGIHQNTVLPESVRTGILKSLAKAESAISAKIADFVDSIGNTINTLFVAFIIPFLAFYMLKDLKLIERSVLTFVPKKHRRQIIRLLIDIDDALGNYVRGQFLVCAVIGVMAYLAYVIIGAPYPILLASVVAVFNIIPYLGPFFGAAPAVVMASTISVKMVIMVVIANTAIQVLEGNVISPQIVGRTLHLHPLLIIFALLVGGQIAGIVGLILAVPALAVLREVIHHWRIHYGKPT